jgi:bifunctional DNase/RNase
LDAIILMYLHELTSCARHGRALVVLEDVAQTRRLTFYADPHETHRLAQAMASGPNVCHPVYDFVRALLRQLGAAPTRVVLEDVDGHGVGALVYVRHGEEDVAVSCYPPDALAVAVRETLPIYATPAALAHAQPLPSPDGEQGQVSAWLWRIHPRDFEA